MGNSLLSIWAISQVTVNQEMGYNPPMDQKWEKRLRDRVEQSGLTMKAASLAAGLNETFVRDILERKRVPSIDKFAKLAEVLGTTVSDILDEQSASSQKPDESPVMGAENIQALLRRIEGLTETDVGILMSIIHNALSVNTAVQVRSRDHDQRENETDLHGSLPSQK